MVLGVRAIPFTFVAHVLAILGLVFVLVWTLDFRGGFNVEHVVREEKTIAAFELIEIYCELIAARLPIIESQKNSNL
ncbi:hypothetical protein RGQ29_016804 [Quercus rubra]|uniref:Uncharacterized protein n=1 Tax=Quercus rubra TaxID=3512 RepID=A0AAN7FF45_QUERU|nr:hypothetical protein RGQ29_016804 [Quercus rubra]